MAAGDYTIELVIGAWSVTMDKGDLIDPASDAIAIDPLNASWSLTGGYPSQPTPTTCSFGLYVPDILTGPRPVQGTRVEVTITTPDHDAGALDIAPVFEFVGLVTDVDADVLADGLRFSIVAADYVSTVAEERIGDVPWPLENGYARLDHIIGASSLPILHPITDAADWLFSTSTINLEIAARDVDSQPTRGLLDELLAKMVAWHGPAPWGWIVKRGGFFEAPSLNTWLLPVLAQSVDGAGVVTFPITFLTSGGPDVDAMLPYTVAMVAGVLNMQRKAITPDSSRVAWIPSSAIQRDSVKWRQDKATNTNRVRATAPTFFAGEDAGSLTAEYPDLIDEFGPVERSVAFDSTTGYPVVPVNLIYALLGRHYDAEPRWTLDTFTIIGEQIADGDQWPRLFDPREELRYFDRAAGKFILVTDVPAKWNLGIEVTGSSDLRPADYWGRLAGASLALAKGKLRWTATLAHRLPWGACYELPDLADDLDTYAPVHHPITYAELGAGANPDYNQCGDLTPADLQLVEG